MTIGTEVCIIAIRGNGATTAFPFDFLVPDIDALLVYVQDAETRETVETLTFPDFSVSGLGNPAGGSITYIPVGGALTSGYYLVIERAVPYLQDLSLPTYSGWNPQAVEAGLDNLEMQIQQVKEKGDRAIISAYGAPQYSFGDDIEVGDTLMMGAGNVIVDGPSAGEISSAEGYALRAEAAAAGLIGREAYCVNIAQVAALDPAAVQVALLSIPDAVGQSEFTSKFIWRTDKNYTALVAGDPNHFRYIESDDFFPDEGCWVAETFPTAPIVDGTRPLRYTDFYRAAGKDHNAAMEAVFSAMMNGGTNPYRFYMDGEGMTVILDEPLTPTGGVQQFFYILNTRFLASDTSWVGDYMFDFSGLGSGPNIRFTNCIFDGNLVAHWILSTGTAVEANYCRFEDNRDDSMPGIDMQGTSHIKLYGGTRVSSPDDSLAPNVRNRIGMRCAGGDQKVFDATFHWFKYSMIFDGFHATLGNIHVYQGTGAGVMDALPSPGIKFTSGKMGALINGLYLDKCSIEISNESDLTQTEIGGLQVTGMTTALNYSGTDFAFIQVRDYGGHSGECFVTDIAVNGAEFRNQNSAVNLPYKIYNPSAFDTSKNNNIVTSGQTSFLNFQPMYSNPTMVKTFSASTSHSFDFTGFLPFGSQIKAVTACVGKPSSGGGQSLDITGITPSTDVVTVGTATDWAGDITLSVSINTPDTNGLVNK